MSGFGSQRPVPSRRSLDWQEYAACRTADPGLFDELPMRATRGDRARVLAAIEICSTCPVREACLNFGITHRETGVWGGRYLVEGDIRPVVPRRNVYTAQRSVA